MVHPRNPDIILERTTFGILLSEDHGKSFHWICEPIIGFSNGLDPGVGVFEDGSYAVAGYYGLAVSHDNACSFPFMGGGLKDQYVIDISVDAKTPRNAVAITALKEGLPSTHIQVVETRDNGVTWQPTGDDIKEQLVVTTIDVAPSDPKRLYISGSYFANGERFGFVMTSKDRGKTWGPKTSIGSRQKPAVAIYMSGVDPTNADRVFARIYSPDNKDTLLVSDDGFATYKELIQFKGSMYGFAIHPTGSKVVIGGSADGVWMADRPASGIGYVFKKQAETPVNCLRWTDETLYGCGYPNQGPGTFVVAHSEDDGAHWTPMITALEDISATLTRCPANSDYNEKCIPDWPRQACLFAKPGQLDECAKVLQPDAGTGNPSAPSDGGGCALRTIPSAAPKTATGIAAAVFGIGLLARRRRARPGRRP
ncbi:WD40/YVTN/BNR-like repeat-containing protein [Pendulispora albinea]|uniref:Exo-alpha-sialidase n=1 Tax=Pendulispora albinea TaxID=2741071 RepID=A0ABZ2M5E5_9BACT